MAENVQHRNVGNLGDIHKHAALVEMASLVQSRNPAETINYLDTHTFLLQTNVADAGSWREETAEPHYRRYREIESSKVDKGRYLCSTGLALELLTAPRLFLAEHHEATRCELKEQLSQENTHPQILAKEIGGLGAIDLSGHAGPLVALFDPFAMSDEELLREWDIARRAAASLTATGKDGVILTFQWRRAKEGIALDAPEGYDGPVATISDAPYHLAMYATAGLAKGAGASLRSLGWTEPADPTKESCSAEPEDRARNTKTCLVGIDLAWGTRNDSGIAVWDACRDSRADVFLYSPPERADADAVAKDILKQVLQSIPDNEPDSMIIAIDAPLKCPRDADDGRAWEGEFDSGDTEYARWGGQVMPPLVRELENAGFTDLLMDPIVDVEAIRSGEAIGKRYVEVYPNVTLWALRRKKTSYKPKGEDTRSLDELVACLRTAVHAVEKVVPFEYMRPALEDISDEPARKRVEDQFDGLVCLYTAWLLLAEEQTIRDTFPGGGLFAIGGVGECVGEGGILAPLSVGMPGFRRNNQSDQLVAEDIRSPENRELFTPLIVPGAHFEPNAEQEAIIDCEKRVVRVIARAGTGKTTTMVARAKKIVEDDPAARVLMLTFTRNAAREMRESLKNRIPDPGKASRCHATTYHGHAFRSLIRYDGDANGWPPASSCTLLNEIGRESILDYYRRLNKDQGWNDGDLTNVINNTRPSGTPDELVARSGANLPNSDAIAKAWPKLLQFYRERAILDFDLIMVLNEYLLRTSREYRNVAMSADSGTGEPAPITHLIADEFQDTNWPQLQSLLHMAGLSPETHGDSTARQVMVVGDDFQTIYEFRGAVPGIFGELVKAADAAGVATGPPLPLKGNYRSTPGIIEYANQVASNLRNRSEHQDTCKLVGHELRPERQDSQNPDPQRAACVADAATVLLQSGFKGEDIVVLAFKNNTLATDAQSLKAKGIPAALTTAKPDEMPGFRLFHAALMIAHTSSSGEPDLAASWEIARQNGIPAEMLQAIIDATPARERAGRLGPIGEAVHAFLQENLDLSTRQGLTMFLDRLARKSPTIAHDRDMCERLINAFLDDPDAKADPRRVLSEMTRRDFAGAQGDPKAIQLCTVHGFKGLERPGVILHNDGFMNADRGEKMRLDYVARTRARDRLIVVDPPDDSLSQAEPTSAPLDKEILDMAEPSGWIKTGDVYTNVNTGEQRDTPPTGDEDQHEPQAEAVLPETLEDLLNMMLEKKVKCTLSTANAFLDEENDFGDVGHCGAENLAQAHLVKGNCQATGRWDSNPEIRDYVNGLTNCARNADQLRGFLQQ